MTFNYRSRELIVLGYIMDHGWNRISNRSGLNVVHAFFFLIWHGSHLGVSRENSHINRKRASSEPCLILIYFPMVQKPVEVPPYPP